MIGLYPDKRAVARNFSRAAPSYDIWAAPQSRCAEELVRRLPEGFKPIHIVDVGCGTGLLSGLLLQRYPEARLTGLDLADGMIAICRARWQDERRAQFRVADCEGEDVPPNERNTDVVACSCSAQWFSDAETTLVRWADVLAPGGILACALLIAGSFCELEAAYLEATKTAFPGLRLPDAEIGRRVARAAGLRVRVCEVDRFASAYPSPLNALRYFKGIGGMFHRQPGYAPLNPVLTRRLLACYDQRVDIRDGVTVTHVAQYLVAEKPS